MWYKGVTRSRDVTKKSRESVQTKKKIATKPRKDSKQAPIHPTLLERCHDTTIHYFFDNFPSGIFILNFLSASLAAFWVRDSQRLALMAVRVRLARLSPTKAARPRW